MKTFNNQLDLTAFWEQGPNGGPALKAYKCPAGKWTIGYGTIVHDGVPVTSDMTCTADQAMEWLEYEFNRVRAELYATIMSGWRRYRVESVTDYAYNVGFNGFPILSEKLKYGQISDASLEFLNGIYTGSKPLLGLLLRRISEYHTFTTGEYIAWEKGDPITMDLKEKLLTMNSKNQAAVNMIYGLKVQEDV